MMLLEQQKNAPNWESGSKIRLSEFDLTTHRASSKHFQNKNDNLNEFGA
jgi:hypothetical protein